MTTHQTKRHAWDPERIAMREEVVRFKLAGLGFREIGRRVGSATTTANQQSWPIRALITAYHRTC